MKQYANVADHLAFSYPSTWQVASWKIADLGDALLKSIAPTLLVCMSPDQLAGLSALVAQHATGTAALRAKVTALIHDNMTTVTGAIKFDTAALNGVSYLRATFAGKNTTQHPVEASILATSRGNRTYYLLVATDTKPAASHQERSALAAIVASVKLT
jgi:hypothetical protein